MLIVYSIVFICIWEFILFYFLPFNYIVYFIFILLLLFCFVLKYNFPLAAVANKFPRLWENKGILILILILCTIA